MDVQLPKQTNEQMDYIANWPMPPVEVGEMIVWLPDYKKPDVKAAGFATAVSQRSIVCRAVEGEHELFRYDVLHKDDPRLQTNQYMRQNGAWDYAPTSARLRRIEADNIAIRDLLAEIMGEDDFNELVSEAAEVAAEDPVKAAEDTVEAARRKGVQERTSKAAKTKRTKKEEREKQREYNRLSYQRRKEREAAEAAKAEVGELQTVE
jgi:hypothetical protein